MKNSPIRYGFVTKALHWTVFVLILNQFVVAAMMLNTPQGQTTAGFTQGTLYNWHKSIGLVVLLVALARYIWRKATPLPDWAPNLSDGEKRTLSWIEPTLYLCMFLMPVSGYVFVMTGGYGVNFFGVWHMPNLLGKHPVIAPIAEWTHKLTAVLLFVALLAHWTLGIRHHWVHRDRYLHRMLPFTHQK
jgi:cytochrome b561